MKKLEGEPSEAGESAAIGAIALKPRPASEEQFVRLALARDWAEFLARESDGRTADNLPALKQNATKAIRFDPRFAFGFYVLGRIATLEGLDGHGVRFFRRALGIDPNLVEADRHLRLLTGSTPELPVADEPPTVPNLTVEDVQTLPNTPSPVATGAKAITAALEPPRLPPPVPVLAAAPPIAAAPPPVPAAPSPRQAAEPPRPPQVGAAPQAPVARRGSGTLVLSWALVTAGLAGIGAVLWGRGHSGAGGEHVGPRVTLSSAPALASATATASASTSAAPAASAAPIVLLNPGPNEGVVQTRWSTGHRLFVDGLVVGQTPAQVLVTCGTHVIKVGSAGREQSLDVPCGATLTVDP